MNKFPHLTTNTTITTILWPFFKDHPGEMLPEENFWTLWRKGRLTEADTPTIRLGATPSGLTSAHLYHPSITSPLKFQHLTTLKLTTKILTDEFLLYKFCVNVKQYNKGSRTKLAIFRITKRVEIAYDVGNSTELSASSDSAHWRSFERNLTITPTKHS